MNDINQTARDLGLLTDEEFGELTGTTESTRENWRKKRKVPYVLIGTKYFYPVLELRELFEGRIKPVTERGRLV
jgi:hypothetical protein